MDEIFLSAKTKGTLHFFFTKNKAKYGNFPYQKKIWEFLSWTAQIHRKRKKKRGEKGERIKMIVGFGLGLWGVGRLGNSGWDKGVVRSEQSIWRVLGGGGGGGGDHWPLRAPPVAVAAEDGGPPAPTTSTSTSPPPTFGLIRPVGHPLPRPHSTHVRTSLAPSPTTLFPCRSSMALNSFFAAHHDKLFVTRWSRSKRIGSCRCQIDPRLP